MCGDCPEVLFLLNHGLGERFVIFYASVEARSNSGMRMRKNSCFHGRGRKMFCQSGDFGSRTCRAEIGARTGAKND